MIFTTSIVNQPIYRKRKYQDSATSDNELTDDESSAKTVSLSADNDKRAHHNELERRRRDHIKDHFFNLKSSIPLLEGEKSSRALILKRAVDYITMLQTQIEDYKHEVDELKHRNECLSQQTGPLLASLQLQQQTIQQPMFSTQISVSSIPATSNTTNSLNVSTMKSGDPLIRGTSNVCTVLCHPSSIIPPLPPLSQCTPVNSPISQNNNNNFLVDLSTLLLQNPVLIGQLQRAVFEPLTSPSSSTTISSPQAGYFGFSPELIDTQQSRLLASSLALRERQFAEAVATGL